MRLFKKAFSLFVRSHRNFAVSTEPITSLPSRVHTRIYPCIGGANSSRSYALPHQRIITKYFHHTVVCSPDKVWCNTGRKATFLQVLVCSTIRRLILGMRPSPRMPIQDSRKSRLRRPFATHTIQNFAILLFGHLKIYLAPPTPPEVTRFQTALLPTRLGLPAVRSMIIPCQYCTWTGVLVQKNTIELRWPCSAQLTPPDAIRRWFSHYHYSSLWQTQPDLFSR